MFFSVHSRIADFPSISQHSGRLVPRSSVRLSEVFPSYPDRQHAGDYIAKAGRNEYVGKFKCRKVETSGVDFVHQSLCWQP